MDSENDFLRIGYAGRLRARKPGNDQVGVMHSLKQFFWEYRAKNVDPGTRSGFYLFKGIQKLKQDNPELVKKLKLSFWGSIDPLHIGQAKKMGIAEVLDFGGYKSRSETLEQLNKCDVLFLPLESGLKGQKPLFIPGKLYEYLKIGKPVLALTGHSDCRDILLRSRMAQVCDPKSEDEIANALRFFIRNKFKPEEEEFNPDFEYINSNFTFEALTGKLASIFDEVLSH